MSDDEAHNQTFEQVCLVCFLLVTHLVLMYCVLGQCRGLAHLPYAMLRTPQERSRRHQGYVFDSVTPGLS
jgi:hypothetical protein